MPKLWDRKSKLDSFKIFNLAKILDWTTFEKACQLLPLLFITIFSLVVMHVLPHFRQAAFLCEV
jgi:hypothetical protein